jgi:hypothetical protein
MDTRIINWQEIASLLIVAGAAILIVRNLFQRSNAEHQCGNCALMELQKKQNVLKQTKQLKR